MHAPAKIIADARQAESDASVEELVKKLKDKNRNVVSEAIGSLLKIGARAAPFLERFAEQEKEVAPRLDALNVLIEIDPERPSVVPALLKLAKGRGFFDSEETLLARRAAGMSLARTSAGIRALPALLKDEDVFVRRSAAFALDDPTEVLDELSAPQRAAIREVLPALVGALDDEDDVVRGMSCEVLGQIVRSRVAPLNAAAEKLLKERGKSRGRCLCECD
jgi:HEAT repeat protein